MTSGNCSEEPIARDNREALGRLAGLADAFLLHDREIHVVADDSVVRVFRGRELPLRRSRGYAPLPVVLPTDGPAVLAVGGELKAAFCVTKGASAYISQHIGDLGNMETQEAFERALRHFLVLFRVVPRAVICDAHPGYLSSRWARAYAAAHQLPLLAVQHHRAHVASLMAEHGLSMDAPLLGVALDGTGYGDDGAIWGGEFLRVGRGGMRRIAHLRYLPLPGGDAAIRHPWRCAVSHLREAGFALELVARLLGGHEADLPLLWRQLERGLLCVPTSSAGRLFDAVAAVLGLRHSVRFEAQAAMQLEALCRSLPPQDPYPVEIVAADATSNPESPLVLDPRPLWRALVADRLAGVAPSLLAARFHASLAQAVLEVARMERDRRGTQRVGLTGGVFQNLRLLEETVDRLHGDGFAVLHHQLVPPNDGGLALGQAWLGRLALAEAQAGGAGLGGAWTDDAWTDGAWTDGAAPLR
jgi:hydrogenase maturation protein HypF